MAFLSDVSARQMSQSVVVDLPKCIIVCMFVGRCILSVVQTGVGRCAQVMIQRVTSSYC